MSLIKGLFNNSVSGFAEAFEACDQTSVWMQDAIDLWFGLYFLQQKTDASDPCQQIPYTIVRKLTKTVFSEYNASSKDGFAQSVLNGLNAMRNEALQMTLIGGEALLKPVPTSEGWRFTVINRVNMLVFGRADDGTPTDVGTSETTSDAKYHYTLLERRTVDDRGYLTIRNKLYRSDTQGVLGSRVNLKVHPRYAELPDVYTYAVPVGSIGLVPIKMPMANCIDGSRDGVSVYAAAVELIRNINLNEAQINGEFERGESRIIASSDLMSRDERGGRSFHDHVFVGLDDDPETVGVTIFSPALREASFLARKQEYLRNVENVIGLKRGLLSEVEAAERTATEITSSQGEYNLTIIDLQQMWEKTVREAVRLCSILGKVHGAIGAHEVAEDQLVISWGNGVLFDEEKTRQRMLGEVQAGLLQPERYLGFTYKRPCDTSSQRKQIRKDYMPEVADEPEEDE